METPKFQKKQFRYREDAITAFFAENEIDKLNFITPEEAKLHVDLINKEYGNIAFVAEDRGGFAVKFKTSHLGEGFEEYKPEEKMSEQNSGIEKAA
jgi:hypothetical protein